MRLNAFDKNCRKPAKLPLLLIVVCKLQLYRLRFINHVKGWQIYGASPSGSFCVSNCPRQTHISASSYENTYLPSIWDWSFHSNRSSFNSRSKACSYSVKRPFLSFDLYQSRFTENLVPFASLLRPGVQKVCRRSRQSFFFSSKRIFVSNVALLIVSVTEIVCVVSKPIETSHEIFQIPRLHICQNSTFPPSSSKVPVFCPVCLASGADCPAAFIAQFHKISTPSSGLWPRAWRSTCPRQCCVQIVIIAQLFMFCIVSLGNFLSKSIFLNFMKILSWQSVAQFSLCAFW